MPARKSADSTTHYRARNAVSLLRWMLRHADLSEADRRSLEEAHSVIDKIVNDTRHASWDTPPPSREEE